MYGFSLLGIVSLGQHGQRLDVGTEEREFGSSVILAGSGHGLDYGD